MFTVVVQAGGDSRRMGQDKSLISFLGKPLIEHVIDRLHPIADELLVTTNDPDKFRFLNLTLEGDFFPNRGALGGLYTAIRASSNPVVAVVACDMPFINPDLIAHERHLLESTGSDVVIPHTSKGLEPFHAVYRREACIQPVKDAIDSQKWRVDTWFQHVKLHKLTNEELSLYDPLHVSFWNVNTPDDLKTAAQKARQLGIKKND